MPSKDNQNLFNNLHPENKNKTKQNSIWSETHRGSYWCVPGRHTTTEKGHGTEACRAPGIITPNKEQRTLLDFSFSPRGVVFVFCCCFFFLICWETRVNLCYIWVLRCSKKHFYCPLGSDSVPKKWEDMVPVPKELEVQPRRWMGNQRHTFGVKKSEGGGGLCSSLWKIRECFLEEVMCKSGTDPSSLCGHWKVKTSAQRLRSMIRYCLAINLLWSWESSFILYLQSIWSR